MNLELMIAAGLGSLCLALLLGAALWLLRVRNPHLQRSAWCAVLAAALAMPLLMLLARAQPLGLPAIAGAEIVRSTTQAATRWQDGALYLYSAVALLLLLRLSWALVRAFDLRRRATRVDTPWAYALDVRATDQLAAPVSIGSAILLPAQYQQWTDAQLRAVVVHESSHIRRGDFLMMNLAQLHRALFWFSPLAWWLPSRLGLLNEHLSDDAAMAALEDRADYARMLLDFTSVRQPHVSAIAMARPATVSQRVERILSADCMAPRPSTAARALLVMAVVTPALFIAAQAQVALRPSVLDREPKSNPYAPLAQPDYPADSRLASEEGTVVLRIYVLEDGRVADAEVKAPSGYPKLDAAAVQGALNWRLQPALSNGKPVGAWGEFAVTFRLTD
jgi:TonB family protein